ncbi:hypothetical protein [Chryseobacterium daecheongense]|nr:hypothetical protein [Chryseobacterium daecheongense]TDX94249.1 hypothetical protein BCF50_0012 [Chryseobacterium daecheongense]
MKFIFTVVFLFTILYSCNKKLSQPIVDYPTDYEVNRRNLNQAAAFEKFNQQTVFLVNNKEYSYEKFKELMQKDKIEVKKITKDSTEIKQLNYPYKKIKTIIIATKK